MMHLRRTTRWRAVLALILALGLLFLLPPHTSATPEDSLQAGPYVDEVVVKVIASQDQRMLAIQQGTIEFDTSFMDPVWVGMLDADPDISFASNLRNGYGHLTINCDSYPMNISAVRRALAFAFNKTRVPTEVLSGYAIVHDSLVAPPNPWCIEEELEPHYYDAQPDVGNAILDQLGFTVNSSTGYRATPEGSPFEIRVGHSDSSSILNEIAQIAVDALQSLHIDSHTYAFCCGYPIWDVCEMFLSATNFYDYDVDWLAEEYWSENAEGVYAEPNGCNFRNSTFDELRSQLLNATSYERTLEIVSEMQRVLHHNVPKLVVYVNQYLQAYRTDKFTEHVEDLTRCISGPWTLRNIRNIDGSTGGSLPVAISQDPDSFNIFVTGSPYSSYILEEMYCSLYDRGPSVDPVSDLATSLLIQTHADNPVVEEGHTRFTIDIVENATWSDGVPLTAEDVAFTFTYILESAIYENPAALDYQHLVASYAPSYYRVVLEFDSESYWHFSQFAYTPIIPKHIFNDEDGIGYAGWESWNPILSGQSPSVWCGPFSFEDYEAGEYYTLTYNPLFYYRVNRTASTSGSGTSGQTSGPGILHTLAVAASAGSLVVIAAVSALTLIERKRSAG